MLGNAETTRSGPDDSTIVLAVHFICSARMVHMGTGLGLRPAFAQQSESRSDEVTLVDVKSALFNRSEPLESLEPNSRRHSAAVHGRHGGAKRWPHCLHRNASSKTFWLAVSRARSAGF